MVRVHKGRVVVYFSAHKVPQWDHKWVFGAQLAYDKEDWLPCLALSLGKYMVCIGPTYKRDPPQEIPMNKDEDVT